MKFLLGPPPNCLNDHELATGNWHRLNLPSPWALQILALPAGALVAFVTLVAWIFVTPKIHIIFAPAYQVILVAAAVFPAGLLIRMLAHPGCSFSSKSLIGFWPSRFIFYTVYLNGLSKRNHVLQHAITFMLLSMLPLLVSVMFKFYSGWLIFVSCLNAFVFGTDVFMALLIAIRVPAHSVLSGRGFETYWRRRTLMNRRD